MQYNMCGSIPHMLEFGPESLHVMYCNFVIFFGFFELANKFLMKFGTKLRHSSFLLGKFEQSVEVPLLPIHDLLTCHLLIEKVSRMLLNILKMFQSYFASVSTV
ncbi:hypothetical protein EXN66_Car022534 [Channa argus]|nr:hypothetical protein EXN66_Car022534 [Channa argus]